LFTEYLKKLVDRVDLTFDEAINAMELIMDGNTTSAQLASFITALTMKGETVDEVAGMAFVMREKSLKIEMISDLVDTCGTGGDGYKTFNVSTAAAFVSAGAGVKIAKHGNRAMSSKTGSADVLEALQINIDITPEMVSKCIEETNFGFMFAQIFHPAMKYAGPTRKEIGIRTIFNILGPLTNPAFATKQLIGVSNPKVADTMIRALKKLGSERVMICNGLDGLDEITISGATKLWNLDQNTISTMEIYPELFGLKSSTIGSIQVDTALESAKVIQSVLEGELGSARDIVLLNSAATILIAGKVSDINDGIEMASDSIDNGYALHCLNSVKSLTQSG